MSSIPNSAMPHARVDEPAQTPQDRYGEMFNEWSQWAGEQATRLGRLAGDQASDLTRRARANPRAAAAIAAGALGLIAAAFVPALRRRRSAFG